MAYGLLLIAVFAITSFFALLFTCIWRIIFSTITFGVLLFQTLFTSRWGIVIAILILFLGTGLVVREFQDESMKAFDVAYECGAVRIAQPVVSFFRWTLRAGYEWAVPRWNDLALFWLECIKEFIADLKALASLESAEGWVDLINALYDQWKCFMLGFTDVPSVRIPFFSDGVDVLYELFFCITDMLRDTFFSFVQLTFFNSNCRICDLDPNQNCVLRQSVPGFPTPPPANCSGCIQFECVWMRCIGIAADWLTLRQFSPTIFQAADDMCCVLVEFWTPPFFLLFGIPDELANGNGCVDLTPQGIGDFLVDDWLQPWVDCFDSFINTISGGTVNNFFELFFAVLFDFVQDVIDTVVGIINCFGLPAFVNCLASYPSQCMVDGNTLIATAGLQTCFNIFGQCLDDPDIPLLQPPFPQALYLTVIPQVFAIIDTVVCPFDGLRICFVELNPSPFNPPTLPNCPAPTGKFGFLDDPICLMECIEGRVPFFEPLAFITREFLEALRAFLDIICITLDVLEAAIQILFLQIGVIFELINDILEIIEEVRELIPGGGFPFKREDKPNPFLDRDAWFAILKEDGISQNTTCGRILWSVAPSEVDRSHWGDYSTYWTCVSLYRVGLHYHSLYQDMVTTNDFMNVPTIVQSFNITFQCILAQTLAEMGFENGTFPDKGAFGDTGITNSSSGSQQGRRFSRGYQTSKRSFDYGNHFSDPQWLRKKSPAFGKMIEDRFAKIDLGAAFNDTAYIYDDTVPEDLSFFNVLRYLWLSLKNSTYYHITTGYFEDQRTLRDEMYHRHGWYPGMRNNSNKYNETFALQMFDGNATALAQFRSAENTWRRKQEEEYYIMSMDALYMSFVNAVNSEYQISKKDRAWYVRPNPGLLGTKSHPYRRHYPPPSPHTSMSSGRTVDYLHQSDLKRKRDAIYEGAERISKANDTFTRLSNHSNLLTGAYNVFYERYDVQHWPWYQKVHMTISAGLRGDFRNISQWLEGEKGYLAEEGFVEKRRYDEVMESRDLEKRGSIMHVLFGNFSVREPRSYGPFLTSRTSIFPKFSNISNFFKRVHANNTIAREGVTFHHAEADFDANAFIYDIFEFVWNNFVGFFTGINFNIDIQGTIDDFLAGFIGKDFANDLIDAAQDFLDRWIVCNIPGNIDGSDIYSPWCFPLLDEGALDWVDTVPNSLIPLQIGWPQELIATNCTNVFNGNSFLYDFALSDNCKINDGQPRPFCSTCDYCERSYNSCQEAGFSDVLDTTFFILATIPRGLDEFFFGGVSIETLLTPISLIIAGVIILFVVPVLISGPQILAVPLWFWIMYLILWTFHIAFENFDNGALPWGGIYTVSFIVSLYYLAPVYANVLPLAVLGGAGAVLWVVSLIADWQFRFVEELDIMQFIIDTFETFNTEPTFLKLINWGPLIARAEEFNFGTGTIPTLDIFCFFLTWDNIALLILTGFAVFTGGRLLVRLIIPIGLFFWGLLVLLLVVIRRVRFWRVRQDVENLQEDEKDGTETFEKFQREVQRDIDTLRAQIKRKRVESNVATREKDEESENDDNNSSLVIDIVSEGEPRRRKRH